MKSRYLSLRKHPFLLALRRWRRRARRNGCFRRLPLPVYNCTLKVCLPRRLVSNFSCLSLKIVKLAFHWRWIFTFVADWHVAATLTALPEYIIIASGRQVVNYSHKNAFFFLFWPSHSQKNAFLERANKRVYSTLRFLTVYFYRSLPGDHRKQAEKLQCKG